eukprot:gnl/TRDRNA2_/TRDRNA2_162146_c0_seq1.p1 gnl/TRDRNA2_/TRDRNA2_162146_c0~~gnl/TRDRNA2_/TRDRNA2_162146_c0_seq1.p1  ORF type:complete len:633 (+),score=116.09 gnl/TRDRNA2_/TRDRNA2_162146_c0_seq1:21-1919(+)
MTETKLFEGAAAGKGVMARSVAVIILHAALAHVNAEQDPRGKSLSRFADDLLTRALDAPALSSADLDSTTLGKPSDLAISQRSSSSLRSSPARSGICARLSPSSVVRSPRQRQAAVDSRTHLAGYRPQVRVEAAMSRQASSVMAATDTIEAEQRPKVPVTVVTGFLGSGKTTLLNNILTKSHGKRIAVIENEFGEIGIDQDLVAAAKAGGGDEDSIMMLNNGCLCCTVRGDLVKMIEDLTTQYRDKFDHIVIETTGLASIAPIIQTFYAEPDINAKVSLDGIVTLVDAKHVNQHLDQGSQREDGAVNEALEQIAYADRIVLNKVDLVSAGEVSELESRLRSVNRMAEITRAEKAAVGVDYVLGVGGFNLYKIEEEGVEAKGHHDHEHHDHDHAHDHDHEHHDHDHKGHDHHDHHHHDHKHDDSVSSVSVQLKGDMDLEKVNNWLGLLIDTIHYDMYRMKGILSVHGYEEKYVFQGVHALFEGSALDPWKEGEERKSTMVFIGKDMERRKDTIREGFERCLADGKSEVGFLPPQDSEMEAKLEEAAAEAAAQDPEQVDLMNDMASMKIDGLEPDELGLRWHQLILGAKRDNNPTRVFKIAMAINKSFEKAIIKEAMQEPTLEILDEMYKAAGH